jgi:hypothetical protein
MLVSLTIGIRPKQDSNLHSSDPNLFTEGYLFDKLAKIHIQVLSLVERTTDLSQAHKAYSHSVNFLKMLKRQLFENIKALTF